MNNAPSDIYVIGTQEAEHSIFVSVTCNNKKTRLNEAVRNYFNAPSKTVI